MDGTILHIEAMTDRELQEAHWNAFLDWEKARKACGCEARGAIICTHIETPYLDALLSELQLRMSVE